MENIKENGNHPVCVIHPEKSFREIIKQHICEKGFECHCYGGNDGFFQDFDGDQAGVLITPAQTRDGFDNEIKQIKQTCPGFQVIALADNASVEEAVELMRKGAFGVVEPSKFDQQLFKELENAFEQIGCYSKLADLTPTEKVVLGHLLEGMGNKQIARKMHRSVRTIEDHRANIMKKMEAANVVDLVKKALAFGYCDL
ncbi:Transcriptional regulatory protein FixJ [Anaerohalosphaera lusitana]|uniref:Transcriptional regulatory protein FixJ n=1 Tax=Anaerohalosphaera lusitana TaxID=1936003 RepID=A0A1U9NKH6_9BACT|nr:response regulator transcription factor [Anaerohalosphaera lusitana]AQT68315.1 Transcriptional regulatory protein FixJ [Anaerohalosphaera lusitana]